MGRKKEKEKLTSATSDISIFISGNFESVNLSTSGTVKSGGV